MVSLARSRSMAATRLSDSQKTELVARFRAGEGTQSLAKAYGCSPATISRTVRAALDPEDYERLKQSGGRRPAVAAAGLEETAEASAHPAPAEESPVSAQLPEVVLNGAADLDDDAPGILAIDDADDFGDDDEGDTDDEDDGGDDADEPGDDTDGVGPGGRFRGSPLQAADDLSTLGLAAYAALPVETRPLQEASLPSSAYMLVDKTVELQARPLSDFPELGPLGADEQQRQALVVYGNPRQAKRQCGRSQRVIKIPDTGVFVRTSRFLVSQGISRVVIEGALYSLPGS